MSKNDEPKAMELAPIAEARMILEAEPQRTIFFSLARKSGIEAGPRRGIYLTRRAGISLPVSCSQGLALRR